jgi:hypothetical protein
MRRFSASIRSLSTDIARELLAGVEPRLLDHFHLVKEAAFGGPLAAVFLGDNETLLALAEVLRAIADTIEDKGESVYKTSSRANATSMLYNAILERLEKRQQKERSVIFTEKLDEILQKKISEILPIISPLISANKQQKKILEQCVLKICDGKSVSTGFALCKRGHLLTAAHAVSRSRNVEVIFEFENHKEQGKAHVIHYLDEQPGLRRDIAILLVEAEDWQRFERAGLRPAPLAFDWKCRDPVLCLGYQEQHITDKPRYIGASIDPWDPVLPIKFGEGDETRQESQDCLVLTWRPGEGQITFGMSGGPVLNLRTNKVIAVVIGAELPAWQRQGDIWVQVCPGYGFAIPLNYVAESWPEFRECCLKQEKYHKEV